MPVPLKFLVDAQLPKRLARWLGTAGHDAIHTLDLPHANRSTDQEIIELAELRQRIVVTKDDIEAAMSKHRLVEINQYGLVIRQ